MPGPGGVCVCGDPPGTATAAGGTHPTGMHSCVIYIFNKLANIEMNVHYLI